MRRFAFGIVHLSGLTSPVYELTLKCDGKTLSTAIATFDAVSQARPVENWETRYVSSVGIIAWRNIRYRIDNEAVRNVELRQMEYSNAGAADLLHGPPSPLMANLNNRSATLGVPPDFVGLPKTRLLVADVFPDETMEFPFSTLTPDERRTIEQMCGLSER